MASRDNICNTFSYAVRKGKPGFDMFDYVISQLAYEESRSKSVILAKLISIALQGGDYYHRAEAHKASYMTKHAVRLNGPDYEMLDYIICQLAYEEGRLRFKILEQLLTYGLNNGEYYHRAEALKLYYIRRKQKEAEK